MGRAPLTVAATLPAATRRWVAAAVGGGARVVSAAALAGGTAAEISGVDVLARDQRIHRLVLKQFTHREWLAAEPDLAEREARVLGLVAPLPVPTPQPVAVDPRGDVTGLPSVLMTRLPGRLDFTPRDLDAWLREMATPLVVIHGEAGAAVADAVQPYAPYNDPARLDIPSWSRKPEAWARALDHLSSAPRAARNGLIHRDFHAANVLWEGSRLSGLLDWTNASCGPGPMDVGHCRLNLALSHGPETADRFLNAWMEVAGRPTPPDPYWDLLAAIEVLPEPEVYPPWASHGLRELSTALVRSRMDAYLEGLVGRLDS